MLNTDIQNVTFRYRPHGAQAYGRILPDGSFLVLAGSTALKNSSAVKKRDREERDRLIRQGILTAHDNPDLLVFARDHEFSSVSRAAGIVKDGNASGPQLWIDVATGKSLKDLRQPNY